MISLDTIAKQLSEGDILNQLSSSAGIEKNQVQSLTKLGLPTIMEALNRNSNDSAGAESLANALESHKGVNLDNLSGFLSNVDTNDGSKILGHIFGDSQQKVQNNLARSTGLKNNQVGSLLMQLAPLVLSFLGNQKAENNLDAGGVSDLTSTLSGLFDGQSGGGSSLLSLAGSILDDDSNGSDLLGNLLGKLF